MQTVVIVFMLFASLICLFSILIVLYDMFMERKDIFCKKNKTETEDVKNLENKEKNKK